MNWEPTRLEQRTHLLSNRLFEIKSQYSPIDTTSAIIEPLKGLQAHNLVESINRLLAFLGQIDDLLCQPPKLSDIKGPNMFTGVPDHFSREEITELERRYFEELNFYKEEIHDLLCHLEQQTTPSDKTKFLAELSEEKIVGVIKVFKALGYIKNESPGEIAMLIASTFSSKRTANPSDDKLRNILYADCDDDVLKFLIELGSKMQELAKKELGGEPALRIPRKRKKIND